uniref:Fibronectin type-III domain-containing protein n=1 Tax=Thermodesulfobacterium geofontis TaxID=1295609 RepID=A0A7V5XGG2_9BACT
MKRFLIIFLLAFFILSCGKKTEPLPIKESIPKGLSFEVNLTPQGAGLLISLPTKTEGGYPLNKIKNLIIERTELPLDIPKAKKKEKIIKLSPKLHSAGNLFIYYDYELKHRYAYSYRIKVVKDFLVETPFSEPITIFWHNPPSFPQKFQIKTLGEDALLITWERPKEDIYGLYLEGEVFYQIEKISKERTKLIEIKNKEEYFDKIKPREKVCYNIRAILNFRGTLIPGPKTPDKCVE